MSANVCTAQDVVQAARTQIGVPWMHQGRLWGKALDCLGLVICTARQQQLVAPDFDVNGYEHAPDGSMLAWCRQYMHELPGPELGAVLAFRISTQPQHLGLVGDYRHGGHSLIHADQTRGRVVESRLMFANRFVLVGAFRLPGVG